jgi:hypothetical protein
LLIAKRFCLQDDKKRRNIRKYLQTAVPEGVLLKCIEAACSLTLVSLAF